MQTREKILDDVARVAGGAVSALGSLRRQIKDEVRARVDEFAQKMDLVPREDFERLELMVNRANERIAELEKKLSTAKPKQEKTKAKATKKTR